MVRKLSAYAKGYWLFLILGPLTVIAEVVMEMRIPLYMSKIVDEGIAQSDTAYILNLCLQMLALAFGALIAGMLSVHFSAVSSMGFGSALRQALFEKVQDLSDSNLEKFSPASLITRLTTDINRLQITFMLTVRVLVRSPAIFVMGLYMTHTISKDLSQTFYVSAPILALILLLISWFSYPRFKKMLKNYDGLNRTVQENLSNIRVVKSFARSGFEQARFKASNDMLKSSAIHAEKWVLLNGPTMSLVMYATTLAVMWFGAKLVIGQDMLTGQLISFVAYIQQVFSSLILITNVLVNIVTSKASAARIIEVLDETAELTDENAVDGLEVETASIEFKNVSFKYSKQAQQYVLENINLKINPGETVGIVGGTGSGKSTLVSLIPRLYEVTGGEVLVSSHKTEQYRIQTLRETIGFVLQGDTVFSGTVAQNLRLGKPDADDSALIKACKAACAHDYILSLENGYDTLLGQNGVNLSGGQRQRLCIARALLKNPKILILDDSTSAVDTATASDIRKAVFGFSGMTKIIIAQRLSSIKDADKIVVLDNGRITDIGAHGELLERCEIYKELYLSQKEGVDL